MCFKILSGLCPEYLKDIIQPVVKTRALRSMNKRELVRKDSRKTTKFYGFRAFSVGAPVLWNSLPDFIRMETNINRFKTLLKTHLFKEYFGV